MNKVVVTKDIFLKTVKCPLLGWQTSRERVSEQGISLSDQLRMEEGLEIHERARTLFSNGFLIPFSKTTTAAEKTQKLLADKQIDVLFEATFCWGNYVTKSDIIKRNNSGWHLYEVKSSVNEKDELIDDMAYTAMVAQKAGLKISACSLILVSKDYRLGISNKKLFKETDLTKEVFERVKDFLTYADEVEKVILNDREPKFELIWNCKGCERFSDCTGNNSQHHIFELPYLKEQQFDALSEQGILEISAIPDSFNLPSNQEVVREAVIKKQPIAKDTLKSDLDEIEFPSYYLDFETVFTCLPLYSDIAPYTQIPTQYSLHKCSHVGKVESHSEYLADASRDCRRELAEKLIKDCGNKGSVLTYTPFEKTTVNGLIKKFPDLGEPLEAIIERMIDLCALIKNSFYHPDFCGSYSIKNVLPVLVPSMSYKDLEIGDGSLAAAIFAYMVKGKYNQEEMEEIRKNLFIYCGQDTEAMVKLHERLWEYAARG